MAPPTLIMSSMMCTSKPSQSPQGLRILHRSCEEGTALVDTQLGMDIKGSVGQHTGIHTHPETRKHGDKCSRRISETGLGVPQPQSEAHLAAPTHLEETPNLKGLRDIKDPGWSFKSAQVSHEPKSTPTGGNRPEPLGWGFFGKKSIN